MTTLFDLAAGPGIDRTRQQLETKAATLLVERSWRQTGSYGWCTLPPATDSEAGLCSGHRADLRQASR